MSKRKWNTSNERAHEKWLSDRAEKIVRICGDDSDSSSLDSLSDRDDDSSFDSLSDSDDDHGDDDDISDDEDSQDDSDFFFEIAFQAYETAASYHNAIWRHVEDKTIEWNKDISLETLQEQECIDNMRFRKRDLKTTLGALWDHGFALYLPPGSSRERVKCNNRYHIPYEVGMIILLYRFSYPRRLRPEMERQFGLRKSKISAILQTFCNTLYNFALPYLNNPAIFHDRMEYYAERVANKCGHLVVNIWGLVDGSLKETCRPSYFQRLLYSGHKRSHGVKFQSVVVPDGLFAHLFGPINGNRHDSFMLQKSQLLQQLTQLMPEGEAMIIYSLYADPAYPQSLYLFGGFRNPAPGSREAAWNTEMSRVHVPVEWNFKDILTFWRWLDFRTSMKIFKCPVSKYFVVAAFLCNLRSMFYQNETCMYFGAEPMGIDNYLNLVPH
jgi:hypothetical protein